MLTRVRVLEIDSHSSLGQARYTLLGVNVKVMLLACQLDSIRAESINWSKLTGDRVLY